MIQFLNATNGNLIGVITIDHGQLVASNFGLQDIADAWEGSPEEFMRHYKTWGNGYMYTKAG